VKRADHLYGSVDTPALLVDRGILRRNISDMQKRADKAGVSLRPHTKTHRTPAIASMQVEAGAKGITVAKAGEAEVMAENGMDDIFIANEIFGDRKFARLRKLAALQWGWTTGNRSRHFPVFLKDRLIRQM